MSGVTALRATSLPVGADIATDKNSTSFRVWAPDRMSVNVIFQDGARQLSLKREADGYFSSEAKGRPAGTLYKYSLDGDEAYPDPASRYQPRGPHGWSQVVDPDAFTWTDTLWRGVHLRGQVIYEMHLGTFTEEGTWSSAVSKLEYLRDTGITVLEVMPISDFPGRFGWGYDGVQPYAPASIYGTPDEMRAFVDRAHSLGLAVILDVVYNHLGPDGNYFTKFSKYYCSAKYKTDWGPGINFDGEHNRPVREYFRENAAYWIREFHLDGFRLDATQDIHDDSHPHIIAELTEASRNAANGRSIILVGENEPQETHLVRPVSEGGGGLDALWNDDLHHSAMVALTGKAEAYYTDYGGSAQELLSAMKYGFLYQGQWYKWQKKRRGTSTLGLRRASLVNFIQNHDQIANSVRGQRLNELSSIGMLKAMTATLLLGPGTPMLFQGQEFASSSPFLFFADHKPELARQVLSGRIEFLQQWRSLALPEMRSCFDGPASLETFMKCKLDFSEVEKHSEIYNLHRDLLALRRNDPVISRQGEDGLDGAVLSPSCFLLRFFTPAFDRDRLLIVNLGTELHLDPAPEPLLGPPENTEWQKLWSSEEPQYGGCGTAPLDTEENWRIPGQMAVLLCPAPIQRHIE